MKNLACMEISGMHCHYVAKGKTDKEVKMKLMEHGKKHHANMMEHMSKKDMKDMDKKMDRMLHK